MVVIKILAYGFASGTYNEYVRLGDNKAIKALEQFVKAIKELYESTYLHQPTQKDLKKKCHLMKRSRTRQACLDNWIAYIMNGKIAPLHGQVGQYLNNDYLKTIILEVICT